MTTQTAAPAGPQLLTLDVAALQDHPRNVRRDVGDVTELAASLEEVGLLEPLVVAPSPDDPGMYVVVAGHRRLAAARQACITELPCLVRSDLASDTDVVMAMLVENLMRSDLTAIEEAEAYQQLELGGVSEATIAKRTGRSRSTVHSRLALMQLPERTREAVHGHQVTLEEASAMVEFAGDTEALDRLESHAGTQNFRWTIESLRTARKRAAAAAGLRTYLETQGVRIVSRESLDGVPWRYHLTWVLAANRRKLTDEEVAGHATCPGHAALEPADDETVWVCTVPDEHGDPSDTASRTTSAALAGEEETRAAEADAAKAQQKADSDACVAAHIVRKTFARTLTSPRSPMMPDQAEHVVRYLAHVLVTGYLEMTNASDWLWLLDGSLVADDIDADTASDLVTALAGGRPGMRVVLAALVAEDEATLRHLWRWSPSQLVELLPYLDLLVVLGYVPSSWEADRIAAGRAHATAEQAGPDEDDAASDDQDPQDVDYDGDRDSLDPDDVPGYRAVETVPVAAGVL